MQYYKQNIMQSGGGHPILPTQASQERYNSANQGQTNQAQNPEPNFREKSQNSRSNPGLLASAQNYKQEAYSKDEVQYMGQQNPTMSQKQGASYLSGPMHQQQHAKGQGHSGQHLRPLAPAAIDTHPAHFIPMRNNSPNSPSPSPSALVKDSARHNQNKMQMQQDRSALPPSLQSQSNMNSAYQSANFAQKQKMYGNQAAQPGEGGSVLAASTNNGGGQHDFHDSLGQGLQQQQYLMGMQMAAMQGQSQGAIDHEHGGIYQMKQQAGRMLIPEKKAYVVQQQDSDFDAERAPPAQGAHKKAPNFITGNKSSQQVVGNSQNLQPQAHNQFHKYRVLDSPERVEDLLTDKRIQQHDSIKGLDEQGQQPYLPQANANSPLQFQHQLSHNAASSQPHLAQQSQSANQNNLMPTKAQMMSGGVAPPSQMYNMKKCISQVPYNGGLQLEQQMQKGSGSIIGRPDEHVQGLSSLDHQNQQYATGGPLAQKMLHSIQMDQMLHDQMHGRDGGQYLYPPGVEPDEPIVERDAMLARLRQGMGSQLITSEEHHTNQQFAVNATNLAAVHQQQYLMQSQNAAGNLGAPASQNGHSGGQQRQPYQGASSQALSGQPQSKVATQKMLAQQSRQSRNANGAKSSTAQHVAVDVVPGLTPGHQDMIFHQTSMQQPTSQHRLVASAMNQSSFQLGGVAGMAMGGGGPPPSSILSPPRMSEMFGGMDNQIIPGPMQGKHFYQMLRSAMANPQDNPNLGDHEYDPAGNLVDHGPQMQLFDNGHIRPSSLCHRPVGATNPLQQPQAQIHLSQLSARGGLPPAQHPIQGQLNSQLQRFPAGLDGNGPTPMSDALSPQPQELNNLGRHPSNYQYGRYASQQLLAGGQDQGAPPPLMAAHSQPKQSMKLINLCKGEMHQPQSQVAAVGGNQVVQGLDCNQYQPVPGGANVIGGCATDGHQGQVQTMGHAPKAHVPAPVVGQMGPTPSLVSQTYPIKETLRISERFNIKHKLGQGTFSFIYQAYDNFLQKDVALKVEKKDKNKSILIFEYNVLQSLKGLKHVCNAHDFVKNSEQNLIVMDLLGANLAKVRKVLETNYSLKIAVQLVIEMLAAIEEVHNRGYIHRDVKASNFVLSQDYRKVFIVDFGLAKKHLDNSQKPVKQRKTADFRGTVSFASLHAHNNVDLSRRDDLWSLYFVILDFLEEKLEWRENKEYTMEEVKGIKHKCLENPEKHLWIKTKGVEEVKTIFRHIRQLHYADKPDYELIRQQLISIYEKSQTIYPQPQLKHFNGELGLPPYSSASQQLMRYGGNQRAYMGGPSASPMYAHMLNPAGDSNLNSVAQLIPSQNLSPRGGILHSQRTDLAFDEPNNGHQYNFNDGIPDWYSKQQNGGNYEAANRPVLHQDDYQKEKMFSEFFTQLCGPANTNAVAQSQAAVPTQQPPFYKNTGGLKQIQSQPQAQPMPAPFAGQQLPQNMLKPQASQAVSVPAGSKLCNQEQAQSQQQSQQNLMFSISIPRKQCKRMPNMGGGMQGGNHMSQQQMIQATNIQGLAAEDVPLQQQQVTAGQMMAIQSQQQSQAALQQTGGSALHHLNMPPMGMEGASPSQLPLCSQMTDQKQQVYAGGLSAQPPSNYGDQHDVLGPSPDVNQAPDGYLQLDQQQQLDAAADSAMLFRMQAAAPHTSEFYDGLEENNPLRQLGMGATAQANEDKYLKRTYTQQQALSAQQTPLDPQNLMLGPAQQPEEIPKSALEGQPPISLHQPLQYPMQRPKQRKRDLKQNEKKPTQRNGLQQIESNGSSGTPQRKMQKVSDHQQQMGAAKSGNLNAPLSPMQPHPVGKQQVASTMPPSGQPVAGACEPGNGDGVTGGQPPLEDQMSRQMGGSNVGGSLGMLPTKENHGRTPQQRLLTDAGAALPPQRQKQLQSKIPPPKDQQIDGGNQHLQHININQNIYLTQPFLLLPQQNADGNKLSGIIPPHHPGAPGQNLQDLFNQSHEQQLAASNDRLIGGPQDPQQQQMLQNLMPPPSQPPQKSHNEKRQQMASQAGVQSLKFAAGHQQIYEQGYEHAQIVQDGVHQQSPSGLRRVQFLRKVLSLQQMSARCLNVGAAASLQQMGPMKGAMDPCGKQPLPVGLAGSEHILQLEQEGKLEIAEIDFSNLKPIKYAYHPELFEMPFNPQLKKQFQAFNRQRTRSLGKGQASLPPQLKGDYKIFRVEKMDPRQVLRGIEQTKQCASLQKDGHFDKLTFNQYEYVCHAYEQNIQDSMSQIPEQDLNQGQHSQQTSTKAAALSGVKNYQGNQQHS